MHDERHPDLATIGKLIDEFVTRVFTDVTDEDTLVLAEFMRELPTPLPDAPTAEQLTAWLELAELVSDQDFERVLRRTVRIWATDNRIEFGLNVRPLILEHAGRALAAGIEPQSEEGRAVLDRIVPSDLPVPELISLIEWLDAVTEPGIERYWRLLSLINSQGPGRPTTPAFRWLSTALRAHRRNIPPAVSSGTSVAP
ncbi:hypothetical protein ACFXHA_06260 [Nocardia sp. NPDC059240]|uniref:hypothetical protein n=1 Tax=Nocardia sp. NPDC059240 TaxID=3346786 RepID=UPI0036B33546